MRVFIGIDPGLTGAVCIYRPDDDFVKIFDMPVRPIEPVQDNAKVKNEVCGVTLFNLVIEQLREMNSANDVECVHVERVFGMPKQAPQTTFSLGDSLSAARTSVVLAANPAHEIYSMPATWKKNLELSSDKTQSTGLARSLSDSACEFIKLKKHHDRAEAFLLAYLAYNYYQALTFGNTQD